MLRGLRHLSGGASGREETKQRDADAEAATEAAPETPEDDQKEGDKTKEEGADEEAGKDDDDARYEQGESVPVWQAGLILGLLGVAAWFGSYTIAELIPTATAPQSIRQRAFALLQGDPAMNERFGKVVRSYGAGYGTERGRRNFVQSYTYTERGEKRTRVKFMVETEDKRRGIVYAEVSHNEPRKWNYVMVEPEKSGGRRRARKRDVIVVEENRKPVKPTAVRQGDIVSRMLTSGTKLFHGGPTDAHGRGQINRLGSAMTDSMRKALLVDCSREENEQRCAEVGFEKGSSPLWELRKGTTTTIKSQKVLELSDLEEQLGIDG